MCAQCVNDGGDKVTCGVCCRVFKRGADTRAVLHAAHVDDVLDVTGGSGDVASHEGLCPDARMATEMAGRLRALNHPLNVVCGTYDVTLLLISSFERKVVACSL